MSRNPLVRKLRKVQQDVRVKLACILLGDWCAEDGCTGTDQTIHFEDGMKMHVSFDMEQTK